MNRITPFELTQVECMDSLVEHRSKFNLDHCELNVFETRQQAKDFHLAFGGFAVTSMLRGKKIMHLDGFEEFEYLPGETVIAPEGSEMVIDFPDAQLDQPTQCTALVIESTYLKEQLARINEKKWGLGKREWGLDYQDIFLKNDAEMAKVSNRLLQVFSSDDQFKDVYADLILQELVLCLLRLQHQNTLSKVAFCHANRDPFAAVLAFIRQNLTHEIRVEELCTIAQMSKSSFYRQFTDYTGMTPVQVILQERLRYAKDLLRQPEVNIKEVAYASGFNDPNYFSRIFKKLEGLTPGSFRRKYTGKPLKKIRRNPSSSIQA